MTGTTPNRANRRRLAGCALGALMLSLGASAQATLVQYTAVDLSDTTPGEDLWQYNYMMSGTSFLTGTGFFIEFDYTKYSQLQDPPAFVNADWDPAVELVDVGLTSNGSYDSLALIDAPSLTDPFSLTFVWLGPGTPGAQPYTLYDTGFLSIEIGMTVSASDALPVPAPAALLAAGLLALAGIRRRWSERPVIAGPGPAGASISS